MPLWKLFLQAIIQCFGQNAHPWIATARNRTIITVSLPSHIGAQHDDNNCVHFNGFRQSLRQAPLMPTLELKIPPPIVTLLCALAMWFLAQHTLPYYLQPELKWSFIAVFFLLGLCFDIAGLLAFRSKQTTINPRHPEKSSSLVSHGIYRITRNPMYVGMVCFLLTWALFLESPMALLGAPLFMFYISYFQIIPEERLLTQLFGDAFRQYQTRVRRWL